MVWIPGGTFRMGSDEHYPEEAPVHRVSLNGFWIDRTPVTNRQFKEFVRATGHSHVAEIQPDPKNYPGRCPTCSMPARWSSLPPSHPVDLKNLREWWALHQGCGLAAPLRAEEQHQHGRQSSGGACRV